MESKRYKNCLQQIRSRATDVVDEKTGLVVKKESWKDLYVHVASKNNFPTAAGLASSAAGFACLGTFSSLSSSENYILRTNSTSSRFFELQLLSH